MFNPDLIQFQSSFNPDPIHFQSNPNLNLIQIQFCSKSNSVPDPIQIQYSSNPVPIQSQYSSNPVSIPIQTQFNPNSIQFQSKSIQCSSIRIHDQRKRSNPIQMEHELAEAHETTERFQDNTFPVDPYPTILTAQSLPNKKPQLTRLDST